jgi:Domain of unknown function (DUF4349)
MKQGFKQRFVKIVKWCGSLFFLMLLFRLLYGYLAPGTATGNDYTSDFFGSVDNLRKNYASEKKFMKQDVAQQASFAASQKYDKTATVKSKTTQFDKDVAGVKTLATGFNGVIQYEQNTGNKGNRELHLLIGIDPAKFDSFYVKMLGFGTVKSTDITKIDKTNEYRQLNAKKASLEKTLASLNELKARGGAITDFVALHDKILDIESKMQELGVELGNFDAENEFCTIKFSLYEGASEKKISFIRRFKIALQWTIKYYVLLAGAFLLFTAGGFILVMLVDKLKIVKAIDSKLGE